MKTDKSTIAPSPSGLSPDDSRAKAYRAPRRLGLVIQTMMLALLTGCGGGSGSAPPPPAPPVSAPQPVLSQEHGPVAASLQKSADCTSKQCALNGAPSISVLIEGQSFRLQLSTVLNGVMVSQTALKAAGVELPCSPSNFVLQHTSTSHRFAGCIASARVGLPGNPVVKMNIALDDDSQNSLVTDGTLSPGVVGIFGVGMGQHSFGENYATPAIATPNYVIAAGFAGFVLDCASAPPSGGNSRSCTFEPRNHSPANALALPMATQTFPRAGWTPVQMTFGAAGSHQVTRIAVFNVEATALSANFDSAALQAAIRDPAPWDSTCPINGSPSSRAGIRFSASAGPADLSFTTTSVCGTDAMRRPALNDWLKQPPAQTDNNTTKPVLWPLTFMLGHAFWFSPGHVSLLN